MIDHDSRQPLPTKLSADLADLLGRSRSGPLTLCEIEASLRGRGFAILIVLMVLPFCLPISIPGLSTPFGFAIALLGLRLALGKRPWLPAKFLDHQLRPKLLDRILRTGLRLTRIMEKVARPRMQFLHRWPGMLKLIGVGILSGGLMLCLPLPIPLSNTLPGLSVLLLTLGLMERDGLLVLAGYIFGLLAYGYLLAVFLLGREGIDRLLGSLGGG